MGLRHKLAAVYVVAALIVAVGSFAAWGLLRLQNATDWMLRTRDVIASVDAVVANLASAESALRAYQATGDPTYLSLIQGVPAATEGQLERLERLAHDHPDQQVRVETLAVHARERLESIRAASAVDPAEDASARARRVRAGTQQMARVRQAAQGVREGQEAILSRQAARERELAGQLLAIIVLGSLASGLLVALLARAIRGDVAGKARSARKLRKQTLELERQHEALVRQSEELRHTAEGLRVANDELKVLRDSAEAARATSERAAQEESRARGVQSHFMAMTTHEIRQPINALLGFAQLLELEVAGPLTDGQRMQVNRIVAGAQHLRSLVDDFLDFAKADAGQLGVEVTSAPVGEAMRSAVELVTPQAAAREIRIETRDETTCGSYRGDPQRVRQILVNLLSNAVKFTPSGGRIVLRCLDTPPPPELDARGGDAADWICFEVSDAGPGIPQEQLASVFEPFVQHGDGAARQGTTGLGLTISRKLAELMGGDLTATSTVDAGSTFSLWLPRSGVGAPHPEPESGLLV